MSMNLYLIVYCTFFLFLDLHIPIYFVLLYEELIILLQLILDIPTTSYKIKILCIVGNLCSVWETATEFHKSHPIDNWNTVL